MQRTREPAISRKPIPSQTERLASFGERTRTQFMTFFRGLEKRERKASHSTLKQVINELKEEIRQLSLEWKAADNEIENAKNDISRIKKIYASEILKFSAIPVAIAATSLLLPSYALEILSASTALTGFLGLWAFRSYKNEIARLSGIIESKKSEKRSIQRKIERALENAASKLEIRSNGWQHAKDASPAERQRFLAMTIRSVSPGIEKLFEGTDGERGGLLLFRKSMAAEFVEIGQLYSVKAYVGKVLEKAKESLRNRDELTFSSMMGELYALIEYYSNLVFGRALSSALRCAVSDTHNFVLVRIHTNTQFEDAKQTFTRFSERLRPILDLISRTSYMPSFAEVNQVVLGGCKPNSAQNELEPGSLSYLMQVNVHMHKLAIATGGFIDLHTHPIAPSSLEQAKYHLSHDMRNTNAKGQGLMACRTQEGNGYSVYYYTEATVEHIGDFPFERLTPAFAPVISKSALDRLSSKPIAKPFVLDPELFREDIIKTRTQTVDK